jgi:HEAT repeat protein
MPSLKPAQLAFFSYAHEDAEFAQRLAKDLRAGGAAVWIDRLDIKPGERWDRAIEDALAKCPQLLVILSPAAVESTNVMDEVSLALEEGKTVLPVIHRQCKIPFRLRRLQYIDLTRNYNEGLGRLLETVRFATPSSEIPKDAANQVDYDLDGSSDHDGDANEGNLLSQAAPQQREGTLPMPQKRVFSSPMVIIGIVAVVVALASLILVVNALRQQKNKPFEKVVQNLDSPNPAERKIAVETLGQPNDPLARDALKKALSHPLRDVRVYAAVLLSKQEGATTIPILIEGLSYSLLEKEGTTRDLAVETQNALTALGSISLPALLSALDSPDTTTWENAARTLGRIGDPLAVDKLLRTLRQKPPRAWYDPRESIVEALGAIRDHRAAADLVAIVARPKEDENTKRKAIWAIGKIGDRDIVPSLIEASKRVDRGTLAVVAFVLGELGDDRAIPILTNLLQDNAPADDGNIHLHTQPMSQIASEALRRIGSEAALKEVETH